MKQTNSIGKSGHTADRSRAHSWIRKLITKYSKSILLLTMQSSSSKTRANEPSRNHQLYTVKTIVSLTSLQYLKILSCRTLATLLLSTRYPLSICLPCCTPHTARNHSLPSKDYLMWALSSYQGWKAAPLECTNASHNWKRAQEHTGKVTTVWNKPILTILNTCLRNKQQQLSMCSQLMATCISRPRSSSWLKCTT